MITSPYPKATATLLSAFGVSGVLWLMGGSVLAFEVWGSARASYGRDALAPVVLDLCTVLGSLYKEDSCLGRSWAKQRGKDCGYNELLMQNWMAALPILVSLY
jgi:hypothetical protein